MRFPIYEQVEHTEADRATLARDATGYKALIARTTTTTDKLVLARTLGNRRLAHGVVPELDACFAALALRLTQATPPLPRPVA